MIYMQETKQNKTVPQETQALDLFKDFTSVISNMFKKLRKIMFKVLRKVVIMMS